MLFVTVGMGWRRQGREANAFPRIGVPAPGVLLNASEATPGLQPQACDTITSRIQSKTAAPETTPSAGCFGAPRTQAYAEAQTCVEASRWPTGRASGRSWKMGHPVTGQSRISRGSC